MVKDPKEPRATLVLKDPLDLPDQQGLRDHKEQRVTPERQAPLDPKVPPDHKDQPVLLDLLAHKAPRDRRELPETSTCRRQVPPATRADLMEMSQMIPVKTCSDGEGLELAEQTTTCHSGHKTLGAPKSAPFVLLGSVTYI